MSDDRPRARRHLLRAAAEFVVIVTGVLVALAADDWRQQNQDRRDEIAYLGSLISDLEWDAGQLEVAAEGFLGKREPLERLMQLTWGARTSSAEEIVIDLINGSRWAWAIPDARRSTFDEMSSAGRLGLIGDPTVRSAIVGHYALSEARRASIDARRSDMGGLVYQLIRHEIPESGTRRAPPAETAAGLTEPELQNLSNPDVLAEIRRAATAEWNFALWGLGDIEFLQSATATLIERLREYAASLD